MALCLETDQLETVQRIVGLHFEGLEVWAYGARVTGEAIAYLFFFRAKRARPVPPFAVSPAKC